MAVSRLNDRMSFGIYKGRTIRYVIDTDVRYIEWALDVVDGFCLSDQAERYYNETFEAFLEECEELQ